MTDDHCKETGTTEWLINQVVSDVLAGRPKAVVWGLNHDHVSRLMRGVYMGLLTHYPALTSLQVRFGNHLEFGDSRIYGISGYEPQMAGLLRDASVYVDHAAMEAWERPIYVRGTDWGAVTTVATEVAKQLRWEVLSDLDAHPSRRVVIPVLDRPIRVYTIQCSDPARTITVLTEWLAENQVGLRRQIRGNEWIEVDTPARAVYAVLTDLFNPYYLEMQ